MTQKKDNPFPAAPGARGASESSIPAHPDAPACSCCLRPEAEAWGRSWVEVDLSAFRRNFERVAARLPPAGRLIVSAKKDAYGHGLLATLGAVIDSPALGAAGVATVEEGLALRRTALPVPVLCFSVLEGEALAEAIRHDIWITITNLEEAAAADTLAARLGRPAVAHLKIDTGMGRTGRLPAEALAALPALSALPHLRLTAIYSHLADAFADPAGARAQH